MGSGSEGFITQVNHSLQQDDGSFRVWRTIVYSGNDMGVNIRFQLMKWEGWEGFFGEEAEDR